MKSVCSKGLALLLAAVLVLALGGCGNGKGYLPSQNATWGELCRHFQSEWFDSLPDEVQAEYDSVILGEEPIKKNRETVSASTPVISEKEPRNLDAKYYSDSEILSNPNQPDEEYSMVDLGVEISKQEKAVDYSVSVMLIGHGAAEADTAFAIYDPEAQEYLDVCVGQAVDEKGWLREDSFTGLKRNHKYVIQAITAVQTEEGYREISPLYVEAEVTTGEPNIEEK